MVAKKRVAFKPHPIILNENQPDTNNGMVRVKAVFGGEVRRFALEQPLTFASLSERVRDAFRLDGFCLKYLDCDGDFVCMSTDVELADAVAATDDGLLRIHILRSALPPPPPPPPPRFVLPPHSRPYHSIRPYMHPHHIRTPPPPPPPPPPASSATHPRVRPFIMHQNGPQIPPTTYVHPPPPPPPPPPYSVAEINADRMLDAMLGAVAWLILGFILHQGLPFWVLIIAFVALHRRLRIRPIIKRNVVAMMEASQMLSRSHSHPHPPSLHHPHPHSN